MGLIKSILDAFINCSGSWMYGLYHVSVIISAPIIITTELLNKYSMDHKDEKFYAEHTALGLIAAAVVLGFVPIMNVIGAVVGLFLIRDFVIRMKLKKQKDAIRKYYVYADNLNVVKNNLDKAYLRHSVYNGFNYSDITNSLISIVAKYKKIIGQELYRDMAANRVEYINTLLKECIADKSLEDNADNILEMLQVTGDFFDELLKQIEDKEKAIRDNKNAYMKQQMTKFNDATKAMKEGLKDIRIAENASKN